MLTQHVLKRVEDVAARQARSEVDPCAIVDRLRDGDLVFPGPLRPRRRHARLFENFRIVKADHRIAAQVETVKLALEPPPPSSESEMCVVSKAPLST